MRKFNLAADIIKRNFVLGMLVAGSLLSSCSKDDDNILPPEPEKPVVSTNDTVCLSVADIKTLEQIYAKTGNAKKTYILKITRDLGVDAQTVEKLHYFGDWKKLENVTVDWSKVTPSTKSTANDSYGVYATEAVPFPAYEQYVENFGGVPLITNPESSTEAKFVVPSQEAEKYSEAGVEAAAGYNGENISITAPDQLSAWVDIVQEYVGVKSKSTRSDTKAPVTFAQSLTTGTLGLRVKNAHMNDLGVIAEHANITNKNLQADEANVSTTADLLSQFTLHGDGSKFNGGKLFKVIGADGVDKLAEKTNGQYLATDTASIGATGEKLLRVVPEKAFVNVHGADAKILSNYSNWTYGQIEVVPQEDKTLPGKQKALLNHTEETLKLISTPAAKNTSAPITYSVDPVLTRYTKTDGKPSADDFKGVITISNLSDGTAGFTYQKMMASNDQAGEGYQALTNPSKTDRGYELKYTCPNNLIWSHKLKERATAMDKSFYRYNSNNEYIYVTTNGITAVYRENEYASATELLNLMMREWGIAFHTMTAVMEKMVDTYHVY